ncbi:hypothetical protein [Ornithinimicrobium kibberense]|uniref:hypothetical protein n=1 Tax=Ornithinimicrobium kibberense TaxID=282060 RepID=UPI003617FE5B
MPSWRWRCRRGTPPGARASPSAPGRARHTSSTRARPPGPGRSRSGCGPWRPLPGRAACAPASSSPRSWWCCCRRCWLPSRSSAEPPAGTPRRPAPLTLACERPHGVGCVTVPLNCRSVPRRRSSVRP